VLTGIPAIEPVMVSEVIPLGTLILSVVDEVPFAIWVVGGTTFGWSLDNATVTF
jgi:hypothetical protein